jgi:hypothetical protein
VKTPSRTCDARADAAGHADRVRERVDDALRGGGHDPLLAAGLAVHLDELARLGTDLLDEAREDDAVQRGEVLLGHVADRVEQTVARRGGALVARTEEAERQCAHGVAGHAAGRRAATRARRRRRT